MEPTHKHFGIDINIDEFGEPFLAANNDLEVLESGLDTVQQDIENRLYTQKGEIISRPALGIDWSSYINAETDPILENQLQRELNNEASLDVRIKKASVSFLERKTDRLDYSVIINPVDTTETLEIVDNREI